MEFNMTLWFPNSYPLNEVGGEKSPVEEKTLLLASFPRCPSITCLFEISRKNPREVQMENII